MKIKLKKSVAKKDKKSLGGLSKKPSVFNLDDDFNENDHNDKVNEKEKERDAILKQQAIAEKNRLLAEQQYADSDVFKYDEYYDDKEEERQRQEAIKKQNNDKSKYSKGFAELKKERERRKLVSNSKKLIDDNHENISENALVFETSTFKKQKSEVAVIIQADTLKLEEDTKKLNYEIDNSNPLKNFYLQSLGDEVPQKDNSDENAANSDSMEKVLKNITTVINNEDSSTNHEKVDTLETRNDILERIQPSMELNILNKKVKISNNPVSLLHTSTEFQNIIKVYIETTFITKEQLSDMRKRYLIRKSHQC